MEADSKVIAAKEKVGDCFNYKENFREKHIILAIIIYSLN